MANSAFQNRNLMRPGTPSALCGSRRKHAGVRPGIRHANPDFSADSGMGFSPPFVYLPLPNLSSSLISGDLAGYMSVIFRLVVFWRCDILLDPVDPHTVEIDRLEVAIYARIESRLVARARNRARGLMRAWRNW